MGQLCIKPRKKRRWQLSSLCVSSYEFCDVNSCRGFSSTAFYRFKLGALVLSFRNVVLANITDFETPTGATECVSNWDLLPCLSQALGLLAVYSSWKSCSLDSTFAFLLMTLSKDVLSNFFIVQNLMLSNVTYLLKPEDAIQIFLQTYSLALHFI